MLEVIILLLISIVLILVGLVVWQRVCGTVRHRPGLAQRIIVLSPIIIPLVFFLAWKISNLRTFQFCGEIVTRVNTPQPAVALTFDDGPTQLATEKILSILQQEAIKATFFLTGAELESHPAEGEKIMLAGHELGNHSYSHKRMIGRSWSFIQAEIEKTDQLIRKTGYQGAIHFRSPFGKKLFLLPYYLKLTHRKNIFWDIEPESYREIAAEADKIVEHVLVKARPGSIILLHVMYPSRAESLKAVPGIIKGLKSKGYRFVTVSELLELESHT